MKRIHLKLCIVLWALLFEVAIAALGQTHEPYVQRQLLSGYNSCSIRVLGDRPVPVIYGGDSGSTCLAVGSSLKICQIGIADEGVMVLEHRGRKVYEWPDPSGGLIYAGRYQVLAADLDGNHIDELIVAELQSVSNGFGREIWELTVFRDFNLLRFSPPVHFKVNEFGVQGVFIRKRNSKTCQILAADWINLEDPVRGWGTYLMGRLYDYKGGALVPSRDQRYYIRRFLNSFAKLRARTGEDPGHPLQWLRDRQVEVVNEAYLKKLGLKRF